MSTIQQIIMSDRMDVETIERDGGVTIYRAPSFSQVHVSGKAAGTIFNFEGDGGFMATPANGSGLFMVATWELAADELVRIVVEGKKRRQPAAPKDPAKFMKTEISRLNRALFYSRKDAEKFSTELTKVHTRLIKQSVALDKILVEVEDKGESADRRRRVVAAESWNDVAAAHHAAMESAHTRMVEFCAELDNELTELAAKALMEGVSAEDIEQAVIDGIPKSRKRPAKVVESEPIEN
ncbi:hypothetical protein ACQPW1_10205 [Nocardia sp. CA-128927]|uniref:hypothetical protein n=1 Tax=Nocardia sp. CA-128927 TaxID=3239975 RepID=UPI003D99F95D